MTSDTPKPGNRHSVYLTISPTADIVKGSLRQNVGRSLRAAASKLDTSTEDLVNKGFKVVPGRLFVDRTDLVTLNYSS